MSDVRHVNSMKLWKNRDNRAKGHSRWLETVYLLVKAQVKTGLPLRGHTENTDFEDGVPGGLYLNILADVILKFCYSPSSRNYRKTQNTLHPKSKTK